jgi:hypothetical protein
MICLVNILPQGGQDSRWSVHIKSLHQSDVERGIVIELIAESIISLLLHCRTKWLGSNENMFIWCILLCTAYLSFYYVKEYSKRWNNNSPPPPGEKNTYQQLIVKIDNHEPTKDNFVCSRSNFTPFPGHIDTNRQSCPIPSPCISSVGQEIWRHLQS